MPWITDKVFSGSTLLKCYLVKNYAFVVNGLTYTVSLYTSQESGKGFLPASFFQLPHYM